MNISDHIPILRELQEKLKGAPEEFLTIALLGLGIVAIGVAMFGDPVFKGTLLAWYIFP